MPTFAVIYYITDMLVTNRLKGKKLPTETDCYDTFSYVDTDGTYVHSDENELKKKERGER